jgi:hypothetical protein
MNSKAKGDLGEDFVNRIAYHTFLKYWCYPNPLDITKDNKEICDLLIVFDEVCIIVSVKNYSFLGNYNRYFRKTVDKALRQIAGAERKLFGDRTILLKHPERYPELFPKQKIKEVFRIIVNTNTSIKFYQTSFYDDDGRAITIFDADAWQSLLLELNTIRDVIRYINERNRLLGNRPGIMLPREEHDFAESDGKQFLAEAEKLQKIYDKLALISGSEKDLIALFIVNFYQFPEKLYKASEPFLVINADGMWNRFQRSKLNGEKKEFESESYLIDHWVKDILIHVPDGEKISRALYKLDRIQRARFIKEFLTFHKEQVAKNPSPHLHRTNLTFDELDFVFVYFDTSVSEVTEEVLYGFIDKSLHHHNYLKGYACNEVVAIAFSQDMKSFGFGYLDSNNPLSAEERTEVENSFRDLGWTMKL